MSATQPDTFFNVLLKTRIFDNRQAFSYCFHEAHGRSDLLKESHFKILRKCQGKFDCLVFEMLYIKKFKPNLNFQTDSIRAKLCLLVNFFHRLLFVLHVVFIEPSFYTFLT